VRGTLSHHYKSSFTKLQKHIEKQNLVECKWMFEGNVWITLEHVLETSICFGGIV
jgi:hypothetical protein